MLPQALLALVLIVECRKGCGAVLLFLFYALLYPLLVPALSIYWAAEELFWGKDREKVLTAMKGYKMFEHLG